MPTSEFGPLVRNLMTEQGLSLRALARRIPVDPGQLSRVLNGKRPAGPALAEACDRVFGTGDLLARVARREDGPSGTDPDEGTGTGRRRVLLAGITAVATGAGLLDQDLTGRRRRFGREDVARIDAVTALYRSLDYEFGGEYLHRDVARFAEGVSRFADDASSVLVAPKLLSAIAAARQLAGWTAFDVGRHADAQRHFLHAERTALAAGNHLLTARIRYCQARQFQHLHHNQDALTTLRLAREQLGARATPAVTAMLHGAEAASLAALDDKASAVKSLASASAAFERVKADDEPEWMRFYDQAELLAQHGRVYRDLARTDARHGRAAATCSAQAVAAFGPASVRSTVLNQVGLCSAHFLADEPEQGLALGERLLARAGAVGSRRVQDRLRNLRRDLSRHRRLPAVAAFDRRLALVGAG